MPVKDLHATKFDEGTLAKLELFQNYLEEWLPVFIHSPGSSSINIIDFFAGAGTDVEGTPGSPLLILNTIEKHVSTLSQAGLSINLIFNDFEEEKYQSLTEVVNDKLVNNPNLQAVVHVDFYNEDFEKVFYKLAPIISKGPNLIFIDQNGIKHVRKKVLKSLDSLNRTDFLFFISSSYFLRFDFETYFPDLKRTINLDKPANIHREILGYYRSLLPSGSELKLYPFTIKKSGGYYGLIFGSKHCLGVQKFLGVCWKKNKVNGEANFDIDDDYKCRQLNLFGEKKISKIEQFYQDLSCFVVETGEVTNQDVLAFTLARGFEPKQAAVTLRKMRDNKIIEHFSHPKIGCEQVYKKKEIVNFRRRH
ncbi:MAG: three-Cys-motif partner protein [Desulforhopalus sp.]|jgi:three-Cys-motif partner protein